MVGEDGEMRGDEAGQHDERRPQPELVAEIFEPGSYARCHLLSSYPRLAQLSIEAHRIARSPPLAKLAESRLIPGRDPEARRAIAGRVGGMTEDATDDERAAAFTVELEHLRQEHRDLDAAIEVLVHMGSVDRLQVQRLKKRKLGLRDRMSFLEDQLTPDIIA